MRMIDRRSILQAAAASVLWPSAVRFAGANEPASSGLLESQRIANYSYPALSKAQVEGGTVTYAVQGPETGATILYFHGWGDDYRVVLPLEYPLIDAGYRLLVVHRPGYAGTSLDGAVDGGTIDWRSAKGSARSAAALLAHLCGDAARVAVIGTSGGAPAALAFASHYPNQTRALILQAGVTQPWTDARFVPELFRQPYLTAFKKFGWAGDSVSQIIFGLLAKLRDSTLSEADRLIAFAGLRLDEIKRDAAFQAIVATMLREDSANGSGELNDARRIFLSKSPYCRWQRIKAPTLVIHDRHDTFVPFIHAEEAAKRIRTAQLHSYRLGGHILWLGRDARRMHNARLQFLQSPTAPRRVPRR